MDQTLILNASNFNFHLNSNGIKFPGNAQIIGRLLVSKEGRGTDPTDRKNAPLEIREREREKRVRNGTVSTCSIVICYTLG